MFQDDGVIEALRNQAVEQGRIYVGGGGRPAFPEI